MQPHGHRNSTHNFLHQQQSRPHSQSHQHLKQLSSALIQEKNTTPGKNKNKHLTKSGSFIEEDVPPPLPQRNQPRPLQIDMSNANNNNNNNINLHNSCTSGHHDSNNNNDNNNNSNCNDTIVSKNSIMQSDAITSQVSDLDYAVVATPLTEGGGMPQVHQSPFAYNDCKVKQRSKVKAKALSDPKMSSHIFLQMESVKGTPNKNNNNCYRGNESSDSTDTSVPPPLPPRQPGMLEETHIGSCHNLNTSSTKHSNIPANSIENLMQYPLVATCTPLQHDGMVAAAFPLSQRPNIVQQLQNHQQHQHLNSGKTVNPINSNVSTI